MDKRVKLLTVGLGALAALNLASCQDYEFMDENEVRFAEYNRKYDEAFIERFGTPAAGHDWGFGELEPITSLGSKATRATGSGASGNVNPNRNMWVGRDNSNEYSTKPFYQKPYASDALAHDIQVPGWPHLNGLYYASDGAGALQHTYTEAQLTQSAQPVGDLTEYEIQYVSAWFRTHRIDNPMNYREDLHLSDFFIQTVSIDDDQVEYSSTLTDVLSKDTQSASKGYIGYNGANITNNNTSWNPSNPSSPWTKETINGQDFYSRTSYGGKGYIKHKKNSNESVNYSLDNVGFKSINGGWTHVNNFNRGNQNFNPEESHSNDMREIKYITSAGTEDFRCWSSWNTDLVDSEHGDKYLYDWVLVHLTWKEKVVNSNSPLYNTTEGQAVQREGYYLAFDFSAEKSETKVKGDGYYSNWIIKITPGHFNPTSKRVRRVMCEDLGGTFDFDFNDVVFDVAYDGNEPIISVQAAGGTMPIVVDMGTNEAPDERYEVHKMLGDGSLTPINAIKEGKTHEVAIYRGNTHTSRNVGDVVVWVKNTKNGGGNWISYTGGTEEKLNLNTNENPKNNPYGSPSSSIQSGNDYTRAPRAFAVDMQSDIIVHDGEDMITKNAVETKWMQELQCIHDTYYYFDNWVTTGQTQFGIGGTGSDTDMREWQEQVKNANKLYTKTTHIEGDNPTGSIETSPTTWVSLQLPNDIAVHHGCSNYHLVLDRDGKENQYNGPDKIVSELNKPGTRQATFTIVLKANKPVDQANIQAILIPANVSTSNGTTTLSYQGNDFLTYSTAEEFKQKAITGYNDSEGVHHNPVFTKWHDAAQHEAYTATGKPQGQDANGNYTYTVRFSFSKDQLLDTAKGSNRYVDYLLLYLKTADGVIVTIPHLAGESTDEWYVHY